MKTLIHSLSLILVLSFSFSAQAWDEDTETKFQAQAILTATEMKAEGAQLLTEISTMVANIGTTVDDSQGFLKALGEKETAAMSTQKEIDALLNAMQKAAKADEIFEGRSKVETLTGTMRRLHTETKMLKEDLQRVLQNDKLSN